MEFLVLSHWHCILPVAGIIIAVLFMFMSNKDDKTKKDNHDAASGISSIPQSNKHQQ
jgi:hypothetical protein